MRSAFVLISAAALALGACSEAPVAPAGAMENFAERHAKEEAKGKSDQLQAARAREADRAADARQKVLAAESIDRFDQAEKALDARQADGPAGTDTEGFTSGDSATK